MSICICMHRLRRCILTYVCVRGCAMSIRAIQIKNNRNALKTSSWSIYLSYSKIRNASVTAERPTVIRALCVQVCWVCGAGPMIRERWRASAWRVRRRRAMPCTIVLRLINIIIVARICVMMHILSAILADLCLFPFWTLCVTEFKHKKWSANRSARESESESMQKWKYLANSN